jgi:hypothetical protein
VLIISEIEQYFRLLIGSTEVANKEKVKGVDGFSSKVTLYGLRSIKDLYPEKLAYRLLISTDLLE